MEIVYLLFFLVAVGFIGIMIQLHSIHSTIKYYLHNIQEDTRTTNYLLDIILNGDDE